jgi:hypothetical protein
MSDARSLIERKMERIGDAPFSYEELLDRRSRRQRRQRFAAAAVAFAVFAPIAVGVGLGFLGHVVGPTPAAASKAEFVREAGAICQWGRTEYQRRTPLIAPRGDWPFARTVGYYRKGIPIFRKVIDRLRSLVAPAGMRRSFEEAVALHERSIEMVATAVAAGGRGDHRTFNRLIHRAFGTMEDRLIAAYLRVDPDIACP